MLYLPNDQASDDLNFAEPLKIKNKQMRAKNVEKISFEGNKKHEALVLFEAPFRSGGRSTTMICPLGFS
ncbi:CLUMA_CG008630, isoform A [Clunio marinus]|uniref:CLUMA_CG008630, isoform A n=1 Tax=Clunio marinus TaxID=568069 RepID=A0A1J1I9P3_9DIPT|nr:CLUMA_CG008630, isoform A [Clunio marinus]